LSSIYSMKLSLPNPSKQSKGFTLIELLVTIAIIAIISVVAVALFGNIQETARDGKRKSELEAIANVLEVNKTGGYQRILNTQFGGNKMPGQSVAVSGSNNRNALDPQNFPYCISTTNNAPDAAVTGWAAASDIVLGTGAACPSAGGYTAIISNSTPASDSVRYKICTLLEAGTVFCRTNIQ
jgi:prepilin-type N-terminal cleavage/methylation domain-containing protein